VRREIILLLRPDVTLGRGLQTIKVRLAEIDAPEKAQPFGNRTKQHLAELCFQKEAEVYPMDTDAASGKPQNLMLLIAEVKEIVPARDGFKAVVKHVPDQAFALDEQLYRRLGRRFESALARWPARR